MTCLIIDHDANDDTSSLTFLALEAELGAETGFFTGVFLAAVCLVVGLAAGAEEAGAEASCCLLHQLPMM